MGAQETGPFHRTKGFSAGASPDNPTFQVNQGGGGVFAGALTVTGALTVAGAQTVAGVQTFSGAVSMATTLAVTGAGTFASTLGVTGALTAAAAAVFTGGFSAGGVAPTNPQAFVAIVPPVNAAGVTTNQNYSHLTVAASAATTIPAGTAPIVASVLLNEPNITATGTVSAAATLAISGAPTEGGVTNASLYVPAGNVVIGGLSLLAQGATSGFLWIPACATGAPNGTPAGGSVGSRAMVFNDVEDKIAIWSGSAWIQTGALT